MWHFHTGKCCWVQNGRVLWLLIFPLWHPNNPWSGLLDEWVTQPSFFVRGHYFHTAMASFDSAFSPVLAKSCACDESEWLLVVSHLVLQSFTLCLSTSFMLSLKYIYKRVTHTTEHINFLENHTQPKKKKKKMLPLIVTSYKRSATNKQVTRVTVSHC